MRRITHPSHVLAFVAFFALVMVGGWVAKDAVTRASVQDVREAVLQGPTVDAQEAGHLSVDGITLPNWTPEDWRLTGGRSDLLEDGREAITGFYHQGKATIALTVVTGSGLDDNERTTTVSSDGAGGGTALTLGGATGGLRPSDSGFGQSQVAIGSGLDCADGCAGPPLRPVVSARRDLHGSSVVLTAWPVNDRVFSEVGVLALRVESGA